MSSFDLAVIVLNYKNAFITRECISSILPGLKNPKQLLLVDNGSNDGSAAELTQAFPGIDVLALPENLGYAGGFNAGIARALKNGAEKILLVNNDTVFEENTIAELMRSDADVAVPKILFFDSPSVIWSAGARWRRFPPGVVMRGYMKQDTEEYDQPAAIDYATGCVFLARKEVFQKIQGFNPDYGNYMEDYDFFYRLRKAGFTAGYVPSARLLHRVSQTLGSRSNKQYEFLGRNSVLFYLSDHRFPKSQLIMYLGWVFLREVFFGRFSQIRSFIKGVKTGFAFINHKEMQG